MSDRRSQLDWPASKELSDEQNASLNEWHKLFKELPHAAHSCLGCQGIEAVRQLRNIWIETVFRSQLDGRTV